jgi:DHA2 family multidrug resistance protein
MNKVNKWIVALTVMLPTFIEIVDTSVVNVALDHIRGSLSAGIDEATWSITSYLVSNAIIIPMTGWLSRLFGRRRYLIISITIFTVSSLLCGFAWSLQSLIVFRVMQGIGGGALQPLSQSILLETFPPKQHGIAMAVFGVGVMFGPIIGPLLGGWITDNWSWEWIFFINVPFGIISVLMVMSFITDPPYMKKTATRIDYMGLALIVVGLGCLQVVLDKGQGEDWFSSEFIVWMSVATVAALSLFIIVEMFFASQPIVNLRVFRDRSFATGNTVMFFAFFNLFASIVMLPIFLQTMMGYTATLAGVVLGPGGVASLIAMPAAGVLVTKINPKKLLAFGITVSAFSTYMMAQFNPYIDFAAAIIPRLILGVGMGFLFVPLMTLTMSGIKRQDMGNATAIFNLVRNIGGSCGVAFVTTMLTRRAQFHQSNLVGHLSPFDSSYRYMSERLSGFFNAQGFGELSGRAADASIYRELIRQATMLAFNDVFMVTAVVMLLVVLLVPIMRQPRHDAHVEIH